MDNGLGIALAGTVASGFGMLRKYYTYRVRAIEHEHKKHSEIEDRRETLEKSRQERISEYLAKFEHAVAIIRNEGVQTRLRIDTLEQELLKVKDLLSKVMNYFDRKQVQTDLKPIGENATLVTTKKTGSGPNGSP